MSVETCMDGKVDVAGQVREYLLENVLLNDGDKLDENVSFQESGILDSTGFLGLIIFVETTFGIEISDDELDPENLDTLSKISRFVGRKLGEKKAAGRPS